MQSHDRYRASGTAGTLIRVDEARNLERFNLSIPARISFRTAEGERVVLEIETLDVSSRGAFFLLEDTRVVVGTDVDIDLELTSLLSKEKADYPERTRIYVQGRVLRAELSGVAVAFGSRYQFEHSSGTETEQTGGSVSG